MAEIKYNNLYNELNPMERRFYDQVFSQQYKPNQENLMLSSQPAYNEMKAVYEAQQDVPKKSLLDSLNLFSSASAAEKPTVPNLSLGYSMPTFDLGTGITNTTSASPFKIGLSNTLTQYNVPGLRSQNLQEDLVQQMISENQAKANPFVRPNMLDIAGGIVPGGITEITPSNINLQKLNSLGFDTSYGVANTPDVIGQARGLDIYETDDGRAYYIDPGTGQEILAPQKAEYYKQKQKPSGLEALLQYLPFGEKSLIGYLADKILPKESPEVKGMKSFYRNQYGLDPVGRVASGIMAGYNPVSGGLLNMITGGKYGKPTQFGLAAAMQKRIENILGRKAPQTDASRARVEELRNLQLKEMQDRADRGESYLVLVNLLLLNQVWHLKKDQVDRLAKKELLQKEITVVDNA